MSSEDRKQALPIEQTEQTEQKDSKKQKQTKVKETKQVNWSDFGRVMRGSSADVLSSFSVKETPQQPDATLSLNQLPAPPSHISPAEFILAKSTNLTEEIDMIQKFIAQNNIQYILDDALFGSYRNNDTSSACKFTMSFYNKDGQIAYFLNRSSGCGIAFARLFKLFNSEASDEVREIATFEPPALMLSPEQLTQLQSTTSNISNGTNDVTCIVDHTSSFASPIQWSTSTIEEMLNMIVRQQNKPAGLTAADLDVTEDDLLIIPDEVNNNMDEEFELDLPPSAQAHMLIQAFDLLETAALDNDCASSQLVNFANDLLAADESGMTKMDLLLSHPILDVTVSVFKFVEAIDDDAFKCAIKDFITTKIENEDWVECLKANREISPPFDRISIDSILQSIEAIFQ